MFPGGQLLHENTECSDKPELENAHFFAFRLDLFEGVRLVGFSSKSGIGIVGGGVAESDF